METACVDYGTPDTKVSTHYIFRPFITNFTLNNYHIYGIHLQAL